MPQRPEQSVTLTEGRFENAKNLNGEKELTDRWHLLAIVDGEIRTLADVRCWMARSRNANTVYASIWVHGPNHRGGHGKAGGYGYCRTSAAVDAAFASAGIKVGYPFHGAGQSEIERALRALGAALGFPNATVIS